MNNFKTSSVTAVPTEAKDICNTSENGVQCSGHGEGGGKVVREGLCKRN